MSNDPIHMRLYMRERARGRAQRLRQLHGGICKRCSATEGALEFHHRVPAEKSFTIARRYSAPWSELVAEAAKCDLLCGDCHDQAHGFNEHGLSRYRHQGCRCEICRSAKKESNRACHAQRKGISIGGVA